MNLDNIKKIFFIVVKILVLFLIIFFIYKKIYIKEKEKKEFGDNKAKIEEKQKTYLDKENTDTDGDGVPDWKEIEDMTDVYKKDSVVTKKKEIKSVVWVEDNSEVIDIIKPDGVSSTDVFSSIENKNSNNDNKTKKEYEREGENKALENIKKIDDKYNQKTNISNDNIDNGKNSNDIEYKKKYKRDINKIMLVDIFNGDSSEYTNAFNRRLAKKPLSESDAIVLNERYDYFKKQKELYQSAKMETPEMKKILNKLIESMSKGAAAINKIKNFNYQKTEIKDKEYSDIFIEYFNAVKSKQQNFIEIHELLKLKKIKFEKDEPGIFFEFSL